MVICKLKGVIKIQILKGRYSLSFSKPFSSTGQFGLFISFGINYRLFMVAIGKGLFLDKKSKLALYNPYKGDWKVLL